MVSLCFSGMPNISAAMRPSFFLALSVAALLHCSKFSENRLLVSDCLEIIFLVRAIRSGEEKFGISRFCISSTPDGERPSLCLPV